MLTRWKNKRFSGRLVYKFSNGWTWQCDLCDFDGDVFQTQPEAFARAEKHAGVCVSCE